ncbi:MAG: ATP-binding protein [Paracoccaceae bacterium]|nr:ATP-binding protein [Paracoccaceae bacterium]
MKLHWLNRALPRSLYGRAAVILLVPVVTVQLVVSIGFIQRHYEGVTRQMTENILLEISRVVARVEAEPDPFAAAVAAREFARPVAIEATLPAASPVEDIRPIYDFTGRVVTATLRAGLPDLIAVDLGTDPARVDLLIETRSGPLGLSFSRHRVSASNPHQLLILMVGTSILMTVIAYFFLWNQLLPVRRMAEAAEAFGRGKAVPFRPEGATELRRAGAAFLEMRGRIERHIDQRTRMLLGVSHDIRTPLTRMRLGLSLMPESADRTALERDVTDMEGMLEAFLSFARGEGAGPTEPADPGELVEQVVEKARRGGHEVSLGDLPADPVGLVDLRPLAIGRALDNLVSNAVRYGDRAIVSLAATQRVLRFTVEDDGPGIPPDRREDALRPFVRLDAARNQDAGSGVGLGLSIAADIARQHGGTLRLGDSARLGGLAVDLVIAR